MDEKEALDWLAGRMPVGDDCYVLTQGGEDLLLTTDMLHRSADFPAGITDFTIGWRSVAVSLSDLAGTGGRPLAVLIAYGAPQFELDSLEEFLDGAEEVCSLVGGRIVGGDLDRHQELTITTTAIGEAERPVDRSGAEPGDLVTVTGDLGRTAAALKLFEKGEVDRANELFRFEPRIQEGLQLGEMATSMMDISDGLARSLHQISRASDVGFRVTEGKIPFAPSVEELSESPEERRELGLFTGEDFELLATVPAQYKFDLATLGVRVIGEVTAEEEVRVASGMEVIDLEDRGYVH